MPKVLAVSGGVDSMVMLHMVVSGAASLGGSDFVVAHFNHGTRPSADDDEKFVQESCKEYGVECVVGRAELGSDVSEEAARKARWDFLEKVAKGEVIYTAHHADDIIESIVINLLRGTGWRGLAPMMRERTFRPLVKMTRAEILKYAAENDVRFRFDPTNGEDKYLRNRVRERLLEFPAAEKMRLLELWEKQCALRQDIMEAVGDIFSEFEQNGLPRDLFQKIDENVAEEILREFLDRHEVSATRPQLMDFLAAIKNYAPGKKFNLPKDRFAIIRKDKVYLLK